MPDYEGTPNLSGILGHPKKMDPRVKYIGPLSRFEQADKQPDTNDSDTARYDVSAILSGPEPQRTVFEQQLLKRFSGTDQKVLIIRGKTDEPKTQIRHQNITLVSHLDDDTLIKLLRETKLIISRSGYTTIMDLHVLGLLDKAELYPTPGQPEQEYLAKINSTGH